MSILYQERPQTVLRIEQFIDKFRAWQDQAKCIIMLTESDVSSIYCAPPLLAAAQLNIQCWFDTRGVRPTFNVGLIPGGSDQHSMLV